MCGGDMPTTRMEKLLMIIMEETPSILTNDKGVNLECSAKKLAQELGTTPQVIGKVMKYCDTFWFPTMRKGKVVYVPVDYVPVGFLGGKK